MIYVLLMLFINISPSLNGKKGITFQYYMRIHGVYSCFFLQISCVINMLDPCSYFSIKKYFLLYF